MRACRSSGAPIGTRGGGAGGEQAAEGEAQPSEIPAEEQGEARLQEGPPGALVGGEVEEESGHRDRRVEGEQARRDGGLDAEPELLNWLHERHRTPCDGNVIRVWSDALPAADEAQLSRALRSLRKRVMLHVLTRDLNGLADLDEVMRGMTALAEIALRRAERFAMQALAAQYGQPVGAESGTPQELLVIGMGKLGGGELNVSSDIDLIFAFPEEGVLPDRKETSYSEFFTRLCQSLVRVYGGMLGSWLISSRMLMALLARTPMVLAEACRASMASLAARRMLRGVVLSLLTSLRTPMACLIRVSYSSFRFAFCKPFHHGRGWAPHRV